MSLANYIGPWIWIYLYVAVQPDDIYFAFDASNAAFNYASFIFDNILKQYLNVAIAAF